MTFLQSKEKHKFHILDTSPLPLYTVMSILQFILITIFYWNSGSLDLGKNLDHINLEISLFFWFLCLLCWISKIVYESGEGHHIAMVQNGLRTGMILFIISEIMFFFAFFWAFLHVSLAPSIEIGWNRPIHGSQQFSIFGIPLANTVLLLILVITIIILFNILIKSCYKGQFHNKLTSYIFFLIPKYERYDRYDKMNQLMDPKLRAGEDALVRFISTRTPESEMQAKEALVNVFRQRNDYRTTEEILHSDPFIARKVYGMINQCIIESDKLFSKQKSPLTQIHEEITQNIIIPKNRTTSEQMLEHAHNGSWSLINLVGWFLFIIFLFLVLIEFVPPFRNKLFGGGRYESWINTLNNYLNKKANKVLDNWFFWHTHEIFLNKFGKVNKIKNLDIRKDWIKFRKKVCKIRMRFWVFILSKLET